MENLPFEIPDSWAWVRVQNYTLTVFNGKPPKYSKVPTAHKVIGQQANQWDGVNLEYVKYCTEEFAQNMPKMFYLQDGDVLLNSLGNGTLGRSSCFDMDVCNETLLTDGHLFVFRNYSKQMSKFLQYYLQAKCDDIINTATGSTNQTFLSLNNTLQWIIPTPPLAEQERIISYVNSLFDRINIIDNNQAELEQLYDDLKKKTLDLAIQGKLVSQDPNDEPACELLKRIRTEKKAQLGKKYVDSYIYKGDDNCYYEHIDGKTKDVLLETPFDLPKTWIWARWGNLSNSIQYGYNAPAKEKGRIKMVRISDIYNNEVDWVNVPFCDISEKEIATYLLKQNDILFARTGGTVGKSYLVKTVPEEAIYAGYLIRTRYSEKLSAQYLKYFMDSSLYWMQLRDGTIATAQPNCNGQTLSKMILPLPPRAEQQRIVDKLNEIFAKI